ncbi:enhancer of split m4 protein-like [Musca vetustissima]|uniref:enhancer of split m4 protein-like n=1 Tax=Musca vetustissima TaxID=27455 RepID=UPI002AB65E24|nr:enhancer of split m4 protein-like [Musca vetustissima]
MCVEITQTQQYNKMDITISQKKSSSSMKKLFKQIFKSKKSVADSSESLENSRNASLESSMESFENDINESYEKEEEFDYTTTVPVHFVRTEQGTYFWTSAAYMQDRWAQA